MIVQLFTKEDLFLEKFGFPDSNEDEFCDFIDEKFDNLKKEGSEVKSIYMSEKVYEIFKDMVEKSFTDIPEWKNYKCGYRGVVFNVEIIVKNDLNGDIVFSSEEYGKETISDRK